MKTSPIRRADRATILKSVNQPSCTHTHSFKRAYKSDKGQKRKSAVNNQYEQHYRRLAQVRTAHSQTVPLCHRAEGRRSHLHVLVLPCARRSDVTHTHSFAMRMTIITTRLTLCTQPHTTTHHSVKKKRVGKEYKQPRRNRGTLTNTKPRLKKKKENAARQLNSVGRPRPAHTRIEDS